MEENLASALAYIPIVGLIFLLIDPYNKNKTIRFHSFQSIFFCIAWIVISIGMAILYLIFGMLGAFNVLWMVGRLINLGLFVLWIFLVVKAYQRDRLVLPIIGPLAEKQA
jgi:uncharacterized membrane protein